MDRYNKKKPSDEATKRNLKAEAMQEVLPGYEEYLVLLQERNRLLKRLRKKSKKQIDIERKEQGFSIYVNGANTDLAKVKNQSPPHKTPRDIQHTSGRLKTAGDVANKRRLNMEDLTVISNMEKERIAEQQRRAKTAPARERRRNWHAASVEIKTERGENRRVRAPELITGNYEDDFEDEDSEEEQMRASMSQYLSDDDSDSSIEIDASKHNRFNKFKPSPKKSSPGSEISKKRPSPKTEEINEKLELSISDVKKLRQSLCMNASIRESIAREVSSESDDSDIEEDLYYSSQEEELSDRESPIPEEEEDIDEDYVEATDSLEEEKKAPVFKHTDTIVLELAAPHQQKKLQHNLSAARKKDVDQDSNGYSSNRKAPVPASLRNQKPTKDHVLEANVSSRSKQERPLSANRRNKPEKVDSTEEASAVMAALKAENEKASKLVRATTPDKPKPRPSSLNPQRKSTDDRIVKTPTKNRPDVGGPQRSKESPMRKSETRESTQGRESRNVPSSPRRESNTPQDSDSFLKNDKLAEIMKKVLLMQPKQQKKLMTVLTKIESSVENDTKTKPSTPIKATEPVNNMVNKASSKNTPSSKSRSPDDVVDVNIELLSTWGHKDLIGLTELQFFDKHRKLIPVNSSAVTVHGARDNRNIVDVIFNGKGKTNKERNMWCCRYRKDIPVEICLTLPANPPIARVKIWNFNKSIQDLDLGVKHARIFIGGEIVFDGIVEKGCGNQVFDYGHNVDLHEIEPSPRSPKPTSPASVSPPPPKNISSQPSRNISTKSTSPANEPRKEVKKVPSSPSPVAQTEDSISKPKPVKRNTPNATKPSRPQSASKEQKPSRPLPSLPASVRSETRTMNHSDKSLSKPVIPDRQSPENEDQNKGPGWWLRKPSTPRSSPGGPLPSPRITPVQSSAHRAMPERRLPTPRAMLERQSSTLRDILNYQPPSSQENRLSTPRVVQERQPSNLRDVFNYQPPSIQENRLSSPRAMQERQSPKHQPQYSQGNRMSTPGNIKERTLSTLRDVLYHTPQSSRENQLSTPRALWECNTPAPKALLERQPSNLRDIPEHPSWVSRPSSKPSPRPIWQNQTPTLRGSPRYLPTPQNFALKPSTPRNRSTQNVNSTQNSQSKLKQYAMLQQKGHVHLPGISKKQFVHMPNPNPSTTSPRKRKTWQTSDADQSNSQLSQQGAGTSKHQRYSDHGSTNVTSSLPNRTLIRSNSNRKQWNESREVTISLASELDEKEVHINVKFSNDDDSLQRLESNASAPSLPYLEPNQFSHHGAKNSGFLPHIHHNDPKTTKQHMNYDYVTSNNTNNLHDTRNYSTSQQTDNFSPVSQYEDPRFLYDDLSEDEDESKLPGKHKGSRTPRKSKRMAAKLDGHSSTENDPRVSDSADGRSPYASAQKEDVVESQIDMTRNQNSIPPQSDNLPPAEKVASQDPPSQQSTLSVSEDDIPMIQKLQQLNQRQQVDQNKKKEKSTPSWLKSEDLSGPFENPPASRQEQRTPRNDDHMTESKQDDIDMLIDEELAMWPKAGKTELKTVFDTQKEKQAAAKDNKPTPMQKINEKRSKWRENQKKNLEESWGSLTMFDRQQKGRISMDLDDDSLDEYLNPAKKQVPVEATIPEEEDIVDSILNEVPGDDNFIIPELPYGKSLIIDILSTWGDRHYVGLTGIQVFSSTGEAVTISKISAEPLDINVLDEYNKDPRVITNVLDGVNRTRDDVHMWLAPFTQGKHNYIYLTFDKPCKIALMRIWNYNKSRIHSYRGAKDVIITLDKTEIFKGEIERACGGIEGGTEAFGDTILFTTDENILEAVSRNDDAYEGEMFDSDEPDDVPFERPRTADAGEDERPFTRAVGNIDGSVSPLPPRPATSMVTEGDVLVFKGKKLLLNFTATWGDMHYLGLTGLEVVGKDGEALPVSMEILNANPRDLHSLPGHESDDRTLDKLIDNTNVTMSDEHMWMIPFTEGGVHSLSVDFPQTQMISGLRIWNYNKSREDTYRGARIVHVTIDGKQVSPPEGYLIRKGPGVCHFDYAQEISFAPQPKMPQPTAVIGDPMVRKSFTADEASQEYESMQMPCGFIYQLQLITTWGDPYYVGLNGLEFYDAQHNKIDLTESNIAAYPDSVNVLENNAHDIRTPDKLIDGVNDTMDGAHMWVAPILPGILNRVYVIFDQPTSVSMIKLWNYSKTPNRGAKDFALLVDDLLVYNGMLQGVTQAARGIIPTCNAPQKYHTILFTDNKEILRKEKHTVISNQAGEQDIQLTNDKKVVKDYNDPKKAESGKPVNQDLRPKTSLVVSKKKR